MRESAGEHMRSTGGTLPRRTAATHLAAACLAVLTPRRQAWRAAALPSFGALSTAEYSNSVIASRDTNVSPKEVYDVIRARCRRPADAQLVLDLGAGAGASTALLYELGWRDIDAVDPSSLAWERFVGDNAPAGVRFTQLSDDGFVEQWRRRAPRAPYDLVVINYSLNLPKARSLAAELLAPGGRLLAPVNSQSDYWFRQRYVEIDRAGTELWTQATVGSWDVLFQPDYTAPTCSGQWCPQLRADPDAANLRLR